MSGRRAGWLSACVALALLPALTACGGKAIALPVVDTAKIATPAASEVIATPAGPTPTPLASGLRATPTPPALAPYNAPAAGPSAGIPRVVIKEFYDAMLAKRNIAAFLTPELRATTNGDGYALLNARPPLRSFSVDSQEMSPDGAAATVGSTLSTASGTIKPQFSMTKQANTWLIGRVTT